MKCIRCDKDSNKRARAGGQCPHCSEPFAFDPTSGDPFTDAAFNKSLELVSGNGKVRWVDDNLRYELARRGGAGKAGCGVVGVFALGGALVFFGLIGAANGVFGLLVLSALGVVLLLAGAAVSLDRRKWKGQLLSKPELEEYLRRWAAAHKPPLTRIVRRREVERAPPAELAEYSFDRAVICDRSETVDLLLANNFHFENNCAVLSSGGYPRHIFDTVRTMLRNNPRLYVFALHDATVQGCMLAQQLAQSYEWFPSALVIDVGLRPGHTHGLEFAFQPATKLVPVNAPVTAEEREWLDKHTCELAGLRPDQIIKRLYRAMASAPDLSLGKYPNLAAAAAAAGLVVAGGYYVDQNALRSKAQASDGGGDSFG